MNNQNVPTTGKIEGTARKVNCKTNTDTYPGIIEHAMRIKRTCLIWIFVFSVSMVFSQTNMQTDSSFTKTGKTIPDRPHSVGSTLFLLGNLDTKEPPLYIQLNYGYQFAQRSNVIIEAITWTYYKPLGIPYGDEGESYPGKIRSYGIGAGYQYFYWKNLYATLQAIPFLQQFFDTDDKKIQSGFQLWCQFRAGYRFEFFSKRWFLEPSLAFNYWPVNTNFPESFQEIENEWPNYFLFEPGLHFGFRF
jgi:hypothetical protein